MKSRRSRWPAGVEPRFCATHLVRNPLREPWSQVPLSASGSPAPEPAPRCFPPGLPSPVATGAPARRTTAASRCPAPWLSSHARTQTSEPPQHASPPESNDDRFASTASIPCKWGFPALSQFRGSLQTDLNLSANLSPQISARAEVPRPSFKSCVAEERTYASREKRLRSRWSWWKSEAGRWLDPQYTRQAHGSPSW